MKLSRYALLALCVVLPFAPVGASAEQNQWENPVDLKQLIPPVVPLPPNSRLNAGTVGGSQVPYTTAPLQNPNLTPSEPAPGFKLTIPTR